VRKAGLLFAVWRTATEIHVERLSV